MSGAVRRGKKNQLLLATGPLGKMKCDSDLASFLPSVLNSSNQSWYQSVQFSSVAQSCLTLCNPMNHSTPGLPAHHQLPEFLKPMSIELVMPSSHLILCHPLFLLPPIFPSIRVFSNESVPQIRWPKYCLEFQLQHQSFQ